MTEEELFQTLFGAPTETDVQTIVATAEKKLDIAWKPYGGNFSNFGIVEAQQASPVPALVEKVTNCIDAILMKRCLEQGINPKSTEAPRSVEQAIDTFFPKAANWDLSAARKAQAEDIQIIADGPRKVPTLTVYDNGEGQHPDDFEGTFLSLLRGNKTEIQFVQGKYNMGGAGAVVFCGRQRFQLVGSKRFDGSGDFGFSLVRKHPLTTVEKQTRKSSWYEYLTVDDRIPRFSIDELDLGLHNRRFRTGTVIKLYSYELPPKSRSVISRDLNRSLNEYLFEPALPLYTIDRKYRYPDDRNLERELYGLKRRIELDRGKYVEEHFTEHYSDSQMGSMKVTAYVFKQNVDGRSAKDSKQTIRSEFFLNRMPVTLSLNGQVHGSFGYDFISRTLKFPILRDYLLIHVDCTNLDMDFRNELFMASRDRVKSGEETHMLRATLAGVLRKGRLQDIHKRRRAALSSQSDNSQELLRELSKNLPFNEELADLLRQTLSLEKPSTKYKNKTRKSKGVRDQDDRPAPFKPQRFPSAFRIDTKAEDEGMPLVQIPQGEEKTIKFATDVENEFFDRTDEPGRIKLAVLQDGTNDAMGGTEPGAPQEISDIFDVVISSPSDGQIRVTLGPSKPLQVGDSIRLRATLASDVEEFQQIFMVKISEPRKATKKNPRTEPKPEPLGLPQLQRVYKDEKDGELTWEKLDQLGGVTMDYANVVSLSVDGDQLETIYINMDSHLLKDQLTKCKTMEQFELVKSRYLSSVYFHVLFLYMVIKGLKIEFEQESVDQNTESIELTDVLAQVFDNHYSEFLTSFGMETLLESLSE